MGSLIVSLSMICGDTDSGPASSLQQLHQNHKYSQPMRDHLTYHANPLSQLFFRKTFQQCNSASPCGKCCRHPEEQKKFVVQQLTQVFAIQHQMFARMVQKPVTNLLDLAFCRDQTIPVEGVITTPQIL